MRVGFFLAAVLSGCTGLVVRERAVYVSELAFADRLVREGAASIHSSILRSCTCTGSGTWAGVGGVSDGECRSMVEWWEVYAVRWPWHLAVQRYNARLATVRPGAVPSFSAASCALPSVSDGGGSDASDGE